MYRWGRFSSVTVNRAVTIPLRLLRTLLLRGAIIWLLARLMGAAALMAGASTKNGLAVLPIWAIVMTAGLVFVDFRRRHELMLFRNLGIGTVQAVGIATLPALVSELVLVMLA